MLRTLWRDESGGVITSEYLLFMSILMGGVVIGATNLQQAVRSEFEHLAASIQRIDQRPDPATPVVAPQARCLIVCETELGR